VTLPRAVSSALLRYGVPADSIAWADDLYRHLGPPVVDALGTLVEGRGIQPSLLRPQDLEAIRPMLGERYLRSHHPAWRRGTSTPAFWCKRSLEATAHGLVTPLGDVAEGSTPLAARVCAAAHNANGRQAPRGLLLLSHGAHRGDQEGSFAFDLVPSDLDEALVLNEAKGRHHTLPGSIGETSGCALPDPGLAIVWEVQPNVWKPGRERNRAAGKAYRRHRDWPLVTAVAALHWLIERGYRVFVLEGEALRAAHEVNPEEPLSEAIASLHDRTFERAAAALGLSLAEGARGSVPPALASLAKVNLGRAIRAHGLDALVREARP
jgi:hypothetical protein